MEQELVDQVDGVVERLGYASRSDFLRRAARAAVVQAEAETVDAWVVGTLTLVYSHRQANIGHALNDQEHQHLQAVTATLHVHLDRDECLEVLILQGLSDEVRRLADALGAMRGVKLARLSVVTSRQ